MRISDWSSDVCSSDLKVAIARPQIPNNTVHRPATIQRIRIGADKQGVIDAIAHEVWSGDLPGGGAETAAQQTRLLYRGPNRLTTHRLSTLDLPEEIGRAHV